MLTRFWENPLEKQLTIKKILPKTRGLYITVEVNLKTKLNYFTGIKGGLVEGNPEQDCRSAETPRPPCHKVTNSITGN